MRLAFPTAVAVSALAAATQAQQPVALPEIVVSGGLTPIDASALGRAVTVVTAEEIASSGAVFAVDALRTVPGVSVSRTGALGQLTQVRLRGAEGNHTKVFIDGVDVSTPQDGEFDFSGLLAQDIERIEVLRGPQSALFGSNAMGGVISVITKRATEPGLTMGGSLEAGTDESLGGSAFLRGLSDLGAFSLSVAGLNAGGYDVAGAGGEEDGARNVTLNGRGEIFATDSITLGGSFRFVNRDADYDDFNYGAATPEGLVTDADLVDERRSLIGALHADIASFGGRIEHGPFASYSSDDVTIRSDGAATSDYTGTRSLFRYRATTALDAPTVEAARHTLTIAAEAQHETFANNDPALVFDPSQLDEQSRTLFGFVAEYRTTPLDGLALQLSLRHDLNDDFEDATTYSAGVSYRLPEVLSAMSPRLHASVGTGVTNPTLYEQFGFIPAQFDGNAELEPEKSFGWDIGIEQGFFDDRAVVDVTYFNQTLEDEIITVFDPVTFVGTPVNDEGESDRQGVEVSATLRPVDPLTLGVSYTWLDATDPDDRQEVRRPRHTLGFDATLRFLDDRARVTLSGRHVAGSVDSDFTSPSFGSSTVALDDYTLINVSAAYAVAEGVELYGGVRNLLDATYEEVQGYATEGVTGFLGVRARW